MLRISILASLIYLTFVLADKCQHLNLETVEVDFIDNDIVTKWEFEKIEKKPENWWNAIIKVNKDIDDLLMVYEFTYEDQKLPAAEGNICQNMDEPMVARAIVSKIEPKLGGTCPIPSGEYHLINYWTIMDNVPNFGGEGKVSGFVTLKLPNDHEIAKIFASGDVFHDFTDCSPL